MSTNETNRDTLPNAARMSKEANRLTAKRIEKLMTPGRYHDGHGLLLQITPSGSRSWLLRYQRDGRERMHGLGPLHTVTLKEARERAKAARLQLLDGNDPIDARHEKRAQAKLAAATATTFKQAAERFLAAHESSWTNAIHRLQWRQSLEKYAYSKIGELPVQAIDTDLVMQCLETVWELGLRGFALALIVIQAPDVDTKDPGPNGQDRQEDEALSV